MSPRGGRTAFLKGLLFTGESSLGSFVLSANDVGGDFKLSKVDLGQLPVIRTYESG